MSSEVRGRLTARRGWLVALAGAALAIGSAGAALAQNQVINAGTNAQQAADALNQNCADMDPDKCNWDTTSVTKGWGPPKIVGDKLYNCSASAEAETSTDATDTRGESTSLSESVALQISVGLSEFAQESTEFKAFSNQTEGFSTGVGISSGVPVSPGFVGWTEAQVSSDLVTGSLSITQGIHLTQVTGIDLSFPTGSLPASESTYNQAMTAQEIADNCAKVENLPAGTTSSARAAVAARAARAATARVPREKPFKLTICQARRGPDRCTRRSVKGRLPERHNLRRVTATLERSGRVHARDKNRRGGIRLTVRRDIKAGRYRLIVRKKPRMVTTRNSQGKRYRAIQHRITIIPVSVRWRQKR
jgi:hypothetical protein